MTTWIVMGLLTLLFIGPLLWRARRDQLEDGALELQADIQAAVNHHLGGESLVAVRVVAGARGAERARSRSSCRRTGSPTSKTCGRWC